LYDEVFLILCEERGGVNDAGNVNVKGRSCHSKQEALQREDAVFLPEDHFKTVLQEGV
jgi:hypothetical protein